MFAAPASSAGPITPITPITAIITTCNRPHLLPRAIRSVLAQRRPADEIVIVDDGADDPAARAATRAAVRAAARDPVRSCPRLRYHGQRQGISSGISSARNQGIRLARHEWLAFLDDDDEWLPDKLAEQAACLEARPGALVAHCEERWFRNGRPLAQKRKHRKPDGQVFADCLPLCCISPSALLIHRRVFADVGLFDETLPVCEDYDMWLRIAARYPVHCVRRPLLDKYGGHPGQLSRRYWGMDRFRIRALEKCLAGGDLSPDQRAAVRAVLLRKLAIYLNGAEKRGQTRHVADFTARLKALRALPQFAAVQGGME